MLVKKVLIVGGGIGGLTAATAFARRGIAVEVVEIKPAHAVHGVGIIQPGNALRALRSLDLLDPCLEAGFQVDDYVYFDAVGSELARIRMKRIADEALPAVNFLPRPTLHRILEESALRHGATIRMGVSVRDFVDDGKKVDVKFSDGTAGTYDIVVGADGIRSALRERLFGTAFAPRHTGHAVWRVTLPRPKDLTFQGIHYGIGAKAGLVPLSAESMYLLLVTNEPSDTWFERGELVTALKDRLAQFTCSWISPLREQLDARSEVVYVKIEEVTLPAPWHSGRIVLLGDAAHASSPHIAQGATMAIEDACVLAEEAAHAHSVPAMFERYMNRRYARCKFVQDYSRTIGEQGQLDEPAACQARNDGIRAQFAHGSTDGRPHEALLAEPI